MWPAVSQLSENEVILHVLFHLLPLCWQRQCCAFSEQRLYVSADPSGAERHPVRHWTLVVPHLPPEIHPQSSALLPWMDLWIPRQNEHVDQSVAGKADPLFSTYSLLLYVVCISFCCYSLWMEDVCVMIVFASRAWWRCSLGADHCSTASRPLYPGSQCPVWKTPFTGWVITH